MRLTWQRRLLTPAAACFLDEQIIAVAHAAGTLAGSVDPDIPGLTGFQGIADMGCRE